MKKDKYIAVKILLIVLGVLLVAYFTIYRKDEKRYQWIENYESASDQPYGTLFFQKLVASYNSGKSFTLNDKKPLRQILDTTSIKIKTNYVLIGRDIYLDNEDSHALLSFIAAGNDALIATVKFPIDVVDPIFVSGCNQPIFLVHEELKSAKMNFYNIHLKRDSSYLYAYRFGKEDFPYFWNTLTSDIFCDSTRSITPLGYLQPDKVNFFRIPYGKGNLYVHTNPLAFTNYFLIQPDKAEYASSVLSYLQGKAFIWDEFSKLQFMPQNNAPEISPISYILQQQSLRYAWWLMLGGALLYALFTAKRKQRVIPVMEEKTNTSLEFVKMIATLHYQNGNHQSAARKKIKYFFYFIRARYGIQTQTLTELYLKRLTEKSKVDLDDLRVIAQEFNQAEGRYYDSSKLIALYNALEKFYKNCK